MFEVQVVEKVSREGRPYKALEITFPNGYTKLVFLTPAEKFMI